MFAELLYLSQVCPKAALHEGQNFVFVTNGPAFIFYILLLEPEFLDSVQYLIAYPGKASSNFLISLQDHDILIDGFEEVFSKLFDFISVDDIFAQQLFWLPN